MTDSDGAPWDNITTSSAIETTPTLDPQNSPLQSVLHSIALIEMASGAVLSVLLLMSTWLRSTALNTRALNDKPVICIMCAGGLLLSFHIVPVYLTTNPIWRVFQSSNVSPETAVAVCFCQLGLFHAGFCLFYLSFLLELYRLTQRMYKVYQEMDLVPTVSCVILAPTVLLIFYLMVWTSFYPHDSRLCLHSRHNDYIFIIENAIIAACLYHIVLVHKIYHTRYTRFTSILLLVGFFCGIFLYFIRLYTEAWATSGTRVVLSVTHSSNYIVGILATNIRLKYEIKDVPASLLDNSESHIEEQQEADSKTMFRRGLQRRKTFIPTPDDDPDALPDAWY